uniref:Uncharacterized protein n=1 Tax=viral metagenome TaxID=1070528 RepID=A0A6C0BYQ0_9ZZZZ
MLQYAPLPERPSTLLTCHFDSVSLYPDVGCHFLRLQGGKETPEEYDLPPTMREAKRPRVEQEKEALCQPCWLLPAAFFPAYRTPPAAYCLTRFHKSGSERETTARC